MGGGGLPRGLPLAMGLIIAGERSGVGKTTITLALLTALCHRSHPPRVQSFKVGPDYIDPMFHRQVTGRPCYNLDPILTSEAHVQSAFRHHSQGADHVLIEGVMGLFDGVEPPPGGWSGGWPRSTPLVPGDPSPTNPSPGDPSPGHPSPSHPRGNLTRPDSASTAHVARLLQIPVALVVDCSHLSGSVGAIVAGYRNLDPALTLAGVILNRVGSDRHQSLLTSALEPLGVPILGILRRHNGITLPDRHLGLVPTGEIPHLNSILDQLAHLGRTCFDWERLEPLLAPPPPPPPAWDPPLHLPDPPPSAPRPAIAWAWDRAFNFYYPHNLEALTAAGADLIPWSPLEDSALPPHVHGLYLGGGFPEVFAAQLAAQTPLLQQLRQAIRQGLPTYGECGGLMYLCEELVDFEGEAYPLVGILPGRATLTPRLTLGYRRATALKASPLVQPGEVVWGHEFHRSQWVPSGDRLFNLETWHDWSRPPEPSPKTLGDGWASPHVHCSYVHLHWGTTPHLPQRFVEQCRQYAGGVESRE